jgi:hypothetical protein
MAVDAIRSLTPQQCSDIAFLEHEFIPSLGLNDEESHEQPTELSRYFGTGLYLWQYPIQLAPYLVWLSGNAGAVKCYMEIGCRWGGTFILTVEWLRKNGAELNAVVAVDPIDQSPLIDEYFKLLQSEARSVAALYIHAPSTSVDVLDVIKRLQPDFVFIDGDHSLKGAITDHMLVRDCARIIVHHDVVSQSCRDTMQLWSILKELERHDFKFCEFTEQYKSVHSSYLGIGVMQKRSALAQWNKNAGSADATERATLPTTGEDPHLALAQLERGGEFR